MPTAETKTGIQRVVALVLLIAAGILSLPVVAAILDGESTEDLIVPIQLGVMAVVGAIAGYLLPSMAGFGSSSIRSAGVGALAGIATALGGVAVLSPALTGPLTRSGRPAPHARTVGGSRTRHRIDRRRCTGSRRGTRVVVSRE